MYLTLGIWYMVWPGLLAPKNTEAYEVFFNMVAMQIFSHEKAAGF